MLSIGRIIAGTGYQYLTKEVVHGAEDYYLRAGAAAGEDQGWWLGAQQTVFGVTGTVASEDDMAALFGSKTDPATGEPLGSRHRIYTSVADRLETAKGEHERWASDDLAARAAALRVAGTVSEARWAESLAAHQVAAGERWKATELRIVRAGERNSVAGYDLTFSAPKSVSVLWASALDDTARRVVRDAHHEGVRAAMAVLEVQGSFIRRGRNGIRQEQVSGVLAAAFDHRTSRTGDPQLHTHVAVLAMAKTTDGEVFALDGRAVYGLSGAMSAVYDFFRDKALARDLGVRFEVCERTGVREIAGVPTSLQALWSSRRAQITPRVEELKAQYTVTHGRPPSPALVSKMGQWATLDTRPAKGPVESSEALFARWQTAAIAEGGTDLARVWAAVTYREPAQPGVVVQSEGEVVAAVVARLGVEKSSWTVPNVMQVVWQVMDRDPNTTAADDDAKAGRCIAAVLGNGEVLKLTPTAGLDVPVELVRADGESVYEVHNTSRYATRTALAEDRYLVACCASKTIIPLPAVLVDAHVAVGERRGLSPDQAAAAAGVLSSPGDVNVIIGPAGAGKTTTMRVVTEAWQTNGGRVLGLALSQTAANELAAATGTRAENIAKFLHENRRIDPVGSPAHAARWRITPGQLVVMDEAGMCDRTAMVAVARLCEQAGAKLVLVGDHEQLESPEARGAMRLMAKTADTFELGQVHRFANEWERDASLRLRAGDIEVLDEYAVHGRIYGGTVEANEFRAVRFTLADHLAGRRVFVLAGTNERAARVAGVFRAGLVAHGHVEEGGVVLRDGNRAGVGDRVVARSNDRTMITTAGSFVTNRSVYQVIARDDTGALRVATVDPDTGTADTGDWVALPAGYVAEQVELEYAGTVHAAEGGTRFACHALISERDSANAVYVALTRGREANVAHVDSETAANLDDQPSVQDPVAVLARLMAREATAEAGSATEIRDQAVRDSKSLATLFPIWQDLDAGHGHVRWQRALSETCGHRFVAAVTGSAVWPALAACLTAIETGGGDPQASLHAAIGVRGLGGVRDIAAVLSHRLEPELRALHRHANAHVPFASRDIRDSPYAAALHQVAARIDRRIVELGEETADAPPGWAALLGPVPADAVGRAEWVDRAGTVAAYREAFGVEGAEPIGAAPPPGRPEVRRWWNAASEALAVDRLPTPQASSKVLAERAAAGDRAETARPAPVDLAAATKADRDSQAELMFALAHQRHVRVDVTATPDDLRVADGWVSAAEPAAERTAQSLAAADAGHDAYRVWDAGTGAVRAAGEAAREELAARAAPSPRLDLTGLPTSWVAYQAVHADGVLAAKQRALASARQAVERVTNRAKRSGGAAQADRAREDRVLLERWERDAARLQAEVTVAAATAQQLNAELDGRREGAAAKTAIRGVPDRVVRSRPDASSGPAPRAEPALSLRPTL